ncbi:MAG: calcium-binding protein, partial [Spirulinaceae cyanobacterium]
MTLSRFRGAGGTIEREAVAEFLDRFGNVEGLVERIGENPQSDFVEAWSQFFSEGSSPVSNKVNEQWKNEISDHLSENKNSVIFVAHSQGNYFVEDGLTDLRENIKGSESRVKIVSLGSPTDYSSHNLKQDFDIGLFPNDTSFNSSEPNGKDPIADLRFTAGELDNRGKLLHAFEALHYLNMRHIGHHDLTADKKHGYLKRQDIKDKFADFFHQMNPRGYYFPKIATPFETFNGTNKGDFLTATGQTLNGYAGNDILRGGYLNDTFVSGSGWDFVDGGNNQEGTDQDRVEYKNWEHSVVVNSEYLGLRGQIIPWPNSDIYRVIKNSVDAKGDVEEDILVDVEEISGSGYADRMNGGRGDDRFLGNGGNDQLFGNNGNDYLDGGESNDDLVGGEGNDDLLGGANEDTIYYTNSPAGVVVNIDENQAYAHNTGVRESEQVSDINPKAYYKDLESDFFIDRGQAQDGYGTLDFLQSIENIQGTNRYNDVLIGNDTINQIRGLGGADLLIGNAGDDTLDGGSNTLIPDGEFDTVSYRRDPRSVVVNLFTGVAIDGWGSQDLILNVENIVGSEHNDTLTGNVGSNVITGGNGVDVINGDAGNDFLYGERGRDTIIGGLGGDTIYGNQGVDTIWGDLEGDADSGFVDIIFGGDGDDNIHAGGGNDRVKGDSGYGNDQIWGDAGNDLLEGGVGNDSIWGGTGEDSIYGQDDNDTIYGESGEDYIEGNDGNDFLDGGSENDELYGNDGDDEINGGFGEDLIDAGQGNDIANGGNDADLIYGRTGDDTIDGGIGNDEIYGNEGDDFINGNDGDDTISGNQDDDTIYGDDGNDNITGDDGQDYIEGNLGDDTISGGNDNDEILGNQGEDLINGNAGD